MGRPSRDDVAKPGDVERNGRRSAVPDALDLLGAAVVGLPLAQHGLVRGQQPIARPREARKGAASFPSAAQIRSSAAQAMPLPIHGICPPCFRRGPRLRAASARSDWSACRRPGGRAQRRHLNHADRRSPALAARLHSHRLASGRAPSALSQCHEPSSCSWLLLVQDAVVPDRRVCRHSALAARSASPVRVIHSSPKIARHRGPRRQQSRRGLPPRIRRSRLWGTRTPGGSSQGCGSRKAIRLIPLTEEYVCCQRHLAGYAEVAGDSDLSVS